MLSERDLFLLKHVSLFFLPVDLGVELFHGTIEQGSTGRRVCGHVLWFSWFGCDFSVIFFLFNYVICKREVPLSACFLSCFVFYFDREGGGVYGHIFVYGIIYTVYSSITMRCLDRLDIDPIFFIKCYS